MFAMIEFIFPLFFIIFFILFFTIIIRNILEWGKNNASPRLTVNAKVVTKRHHRNRSSNNMSSTRYYVTFEVDSGDRTELKISGSEYGMLAEGDTGMLTLQGTRYISFIRNI